MSVPGKFRHRFIGQSPFAASIRGDDEPADDDACMIEWWTAASLFALMDLLPTPLFSARDEKLRD